jgi:hypothetical protein
MNQINTEKKQLTDERQTLNNDQIETARDQFAEEDRI